jgi:DNA-binding ferritin-like protein (Dps family)
MSKKMRQLLEENNRAEQALSPAGQSLLTDVVVYLRGSRVSLWNQEQVRRDITWMLLDAEARGEDARAVIGPDPKEFCDSVIEALPPLSRRERLLGALRDGLPAAVILLGIWIVFGVIEGLLGAGSWPELTLTWGQLLSGVGILAVAWGLVQWICRDSFSTQQNKGLWVVLFFLIFALLCLSFFLRRPLLSVPIPAAVGLAAVLFALYKLLDARLD